jgi:hypothetical protein
MALTNHNSHACARWPFLFILAFSLWLNAPRAAAATPQSVIFVVDSSENMASHIDGVKATIFSYIEQSAQGGYLGVISFSNTAKSLAMKKVAGPSDRKSLEIMLETLTAHGAVADIDRGVERALEEVATLKKRGDKNIKGIVLISASALPEERSLEKLDKVLQDVSKTVPGDEWYIQYCFLDGVKDTGIAGFVLNNEGVSYDIESLKAANKSETIAELYKIAVLPEEYCTVTATDLHGAVLKHSSSAADEQWQSLKAGERLEEGERLTVAEESRLALAAAHFGKLGLAPATDVVFKRMKRNPVSGKADIHVSLESGSLWVAINEKAAFLHVDSKENYAELSGRAGAVLRTAESGDIEITSFSGGLPVKADGANEQPLVLGPNQMTFSKIGRVLTPPLAADAKLLEEWKLWSKALQNNVALAAIEFAIPEVVFPAAEITLGPLQSGELLTKNLPLQLVNVADPSKLKVAVEVAVPMPEGISVTTALIDGAPPYAKAVQLKLDGRGGFSSGREKEHKGFLKIAPAADSGIKFEKISVPLTIITKKGLLSTSLLIGGVLVLLLGAAGFASTRLYRRKEVIRPRPHRVMGRLIIMDDPTKGRVGSINLEEISTKSSRLSLVFGRDRTSEIRLKHASVQPSHCLIEAHLVGEHLVTYIEPMASAAVLINEEKIGSKTRLNDGDQLRIGEFRFQFEDTQYYKKVEVIYATGRRITGVLDVSGMDAEGFKISPIDAVSPSERARVKFSEIRSVTFYRRATDILAQKPRTQPKGGMKRVELMFKKGETLSGFISREYSEGRHRFIELLPLDSNSDMDYTVVQYSAVVEKKNL